MTSTMSPPHLITTTHTSAGTSVIGSNAPVEPFRTFGPGGTGFSILYTTLSVPASVNTPISPSTSTALPRCPSGGTTFATTDIHPGGKAPMHRTQSLDYTCVLAGEIVLTLDGKEEVVVKPGEMIVQRGTMHAWENRGHEVCRMLFVMVASREVVLEGGEELEEKVSKTQKDVSAGNAES